MSTREFKLLEDTPAYRAGTRIVIELEADGRVSWRVWHEGLDYGGDTFDQRGPEKYASAAAELLATGHWQEL